jgi:hypothetical protein
VTECWWPCCSDSYNIRRYDDISSGAPSSSNLVWEYRYAAGTPYYFASNFDRGFKAMGVDGSGDLYLMRQTIRDDPTIPNGTSGPYGVHGTATGSFVVAAGFQLFKFSGADGEILWVSNGLRLAGSFTSGYNNLVKGWSMVLSGTEIFVGGYSTYTPHPTLGPPSIYANNGVVTVYNQVDGAYVRHGYYNFDTAPYGRAEVQSKVSALASNGTLLYVAIPGAPTPSSTVVVKAYNISSGSEVWGSATGVTAGDAYGLTSLDYTPVSIVPPTDRVYGGRDQGAVRFWNASTGVLGWEVTGSSSSYPRGVLGEAYSVGGGAATDKVHVVPPTALFTQPERWSVDGPALEGLYSYGSGSALCIASATGGEMIIAGGIITE